MRVIENARVFEGDHWLPRATVAFEGDQIVSVNTGKVRSSVKNNRAYDAAGQMLIPGLIDLQVNGGGGVLFNDEPSVDGLAAIGNAHARYGTTRFLATLLSAGTDKMQKAIDSVDRAIQQKIPGILGIHLEGPYLNSKKKGVHNSAAFRDLGDDAVELLSTLDRGVTLTTIAPELVQSDRIRALVKRGVIVFAGHSDATFEEATCALSAGVSGFTHLFNAMPSLESRAPGLVGAALVDRDSWVGLIADGQHLHPAIVQLVVAAKPEGKVIIVTDAMPSVGADEKTFSLDGESITVKDGKCTTATGVLAGSDLDMISAVRNTVEFAKVNFEEAVRMASTYPAEAIGLGSTLGAIRPGYQADFVLLDSQYEVAATWIAGQQVFAR